MPQIPQYQSSVVTASVGDKGRLLDPERKSSEAHTFTELESIKSGGGKTGEGRERAQTAPAFLGHVGQDHSVTFSVSRDDFSGEHVLTISSPNNLGIGHSGGSGSGSNQIEPVSPKQPKTPLRKSVTGISCGSSTGSLRARDQARLRTANSSWSVTSPNSNTNNSITNEFGIGSLRAHNVVNIITESPITNRYTTCRQLGEGGYGQVWLMADKITGDERAVKRLPMIGKDAADVQKMQIEMQVFARLQHRYIVKLWEVFQCEECLWLVMDLCLGGDLMDYLMNWWSDTRYPERSDVIRQHKCKGLPWQEVAPLLWQMLAAVGYMHHHHFCHRDVKLENFMIQERGARHPEIKLVDFGMSVLLKPGTFLSDRVGTLMYIAPEVLAGRYTEKCDIWSVGICGYVLCLKVCPYGEEAGKDPEVLANSVFQNTVEDWPDSDKPPELKRLIGRLMTYDPDNRPSAKRAYKESAWLRKHAKPGSHSCCGLQ